MPENDAWHILKAGKRDQLRDLLVDARWIKLRLVIGGIHALKNGFKELSRIEDRKGAISKGSEMIVEEILSLVLLLLFFIQTNAHCSTAKTVTSMRTTYYYSRYYTIQVQNILGVFEEACLSGFT